MGSPARISEMFAEPLMDRRGVAQWAGVAPQTVDVWARGIRVKGRMVVLESVQLPGQRKYTRSAVAAFLDAVRGAHTETRGGLGVEALNREPRRLVLVADGTQGKKGHEQLSAKALARLMLKDGTGAAVRGSGRGGGLGLNVDTVG